LRASAKLGSHVCGRADSYWRVLVVATPPGVTVTVTPQSAD
jgi:hypothetical protein